MLKRACSSAGRALRSQRRGQGFEPLQVHQKRNTAEKAVFFFAKEGSKRAVVNDVPFGTSEPLDPKASSLRESIPELNRQTAVFLFCPRKSKGAVVNDVPV